MKLQDFIKSFDHIHIDPSLRLISIREDFPSQRTKEIELKTFKIRDAFFDDDEDLEAGRKRRLKELRLRIKKRI